MKTLSIITVLLLTVNFGVAQGADLVAFNNTSNSSTASAASHNALVVDQVSAHVIGNIQYPRSIQDYGFEGTAILKVSLTETGGIKATTLLKSSRSKSLDKAILKTLDSLKKIDTQNRHYKGARTIHIPLRFDIKS